MRIVVDLQSCQTASRYRGIGRYSLSLLKAMLRKPREHEFVVVLNGAFPASIESIRGELNGLIRQDQIKVWRQPEGAYPGVSWRRLTAKLMREAFIYKWRPDVVHISSVFEGVSDEAVISIDRFLIGAPVAVTHYDLIPHFYPDKYLSSAQSHEAYYRRLDTLKRANLFLSISDYTREELIDAIDVDSSVVVDIGAGVSRGFRQVSLDDEEKKRVFSRFGIRQGFVLYAGGGDSRKNIENLVRAYSRLDAKLRGQHALVLVCKMPNDEEMRLRRLAEDLLISANVHFISYVSDDELLMLYNLCAVSVLPSLHEGFGLPLLEAMACGAPAIGSNRTSIPEVLGREHAMFDPMDVDSIARKIADVLSDNEFSDALREEGLKQSKNFSWEKSAEIALDAMERLYEQKHHVPEPDIQLKENRSVAIVAGVPRNEESRAAWRDFLEPLKESFDVTFVAEKGADTGFLPSGIKSISENEFHDSALEYAHRLYAVSYGHRWVMDLAVRYPGHVDLQEFFLGHLFLEQEGGFSTFVEELYFSHGYLPLVRLSDGVSPVELADVYPCNGSLVESAKSLCVRDNAASELVRYWCGSQMTSRLRIGGLLPSDKDAGSRAPHMADAVVKLLSDSEQGEVPDRVFMAHALASVNMAATPSDSEVVEIAECVTSNFPSDARMRQLFLDVTNLGTETGFIGDLIRSLAEDLDCGKFADFRLEPVYLECDGRYRYCTNVVLKSLGIPDAPAFADMLIDPREGDVLLRIGSSKGGDAELRRLRNFGVHVYAVDTRGSAIEDAVQEGDGLFGTTAQSVNGVIFLSERRRGEFLDWLDGIQPERHRPLSIGTISTKNETRQGSAKIVAELVGRAFDLAISGNWSEGWFPGRRYLLRSSLNGLRTEVGTVREDGVYSNGHAGLLVACPFRRISPGDYELVVMLELGSQVESGSLWLEVVSNAAGNLTSYWPDLSTAETGAFRFSARVSLACGYDDVQFRLWVGRDVHVAFVSMEMTRTPVPIESVS